MLSRCHAVVIYRDRTPAVGRKSIIIKKRALLYLKYKLFPSEDSDGVKVSLTDVWAVVWA